MGQSYNSRAYTEICFFDDGKSIPGVFASHDFHYPSDCEAIIAAINGTSTKKDEGRGMGLGSSVNLLTNGLNGQVLIVSRKGLVYLDGSDKECLMKTLYELEESLSHQGTMIAVRIPFPSGKIDPYPYLGGKIRILV